jgi:hypothetical protein
MQVFKRILQKLNGLHYPQEFLCIAKEEMNEHLHAFLLFENIVIGDITQNHHFVGYSPLIIALRSGKDIDLTARDTINICYSPMQLRAGETATKKNIVATLQLKKINEQKIEHAAIYYFEGVHGKHKFISGWHQFIIQINNQLYNKTKGNVFLANNLLKQVQIAYAMPRIISLITVSSNGLYNLFPTDLHGEVNEEYYIISLRHEGNACKQTEAAGKILLSNINATYFKEVYGLGKNHMQPLKQKSSFAFSEINSQILNLPLPLYVIEYRELELKTSFTHGIHKILLFKILAKQQINNIPNTLSHIHNVYATWRFKNHFKDKYLLR